jgi:lipopolysaccharide transport system ATP-binding protein
MSVVIKAEHLSKSYIIRHHGEKRHDALRDVIAENVKGTLLKTKNIITRRSTLTSKSKEEFWALQDINFEVQQGDRIGIIGRNGAGKSTLLKLLSRITEPTLGVISIKGRIASLLEVGTGFHAELSGRENVYLNGAILGMHRTEIRKKFDEIVTFAEVDKFLDTPVKRYSSGMYVRLAFAVAAYLESEILVVDEVLAVGDTEFQKKCLGKMQSVSREEGRTVLFVSHNMAAISKLCNKGILLNKGRIINDSDIGTVVDSYISTSFQNESYLFDGNKSEKETFFERIFLSRDKFQSINTFSFSDDIFCIFEINGRKLNKETTLTFIVRDRNLNPIFSEHHLISEIKGRLTAKIPMKILLPGKYYLQSMLHIPNVRFLDNNEDYISFSVEETGSKNAIYNADLGFVNIPVLWEEN